jgi:hypothetical protein
MSFVQELAHSAEDDVAHIHLNDGIWVHLVQDSLHGFGVIHSDHEHALKKKQARGQLKTCHSSSKHHDLSDKNMMHSHVQCLVGNDRSNMKS